MLLMNMITSSTHHIFKHELGNVRMNTSHSEGPICDCLTPSFDSCPSPAIVAEIAIFSAAIAAFFQRCHLIRLGAAYSHHECSLSNIMSFGISAGDFFVAAKLIKDILTVLKKSSAAEYHELSLELHGLQRALDEIEHLECDNEQQPAVNAVKVAALLCQYRLDDFASKLKKFESLGPEFTTIGGSGRFKAWRTKLRWGFCMQEEVQNLRAYLIGHVGSLSLRLASLNLWANPDQIYR